MSEVSRAPKVRRRWLSGSHRKGGICPDSDHQIHSLMQSGAPRASNKVGTGFVWGYLLERDRGPLKLFQKGVILGTRVKLNREQSLVEIIKEPELKNEAVSQGSCRGRVVLDTRKPCRFQGPLRAALKVPLVPSLPASPASTRTLVPNELCSCPRPPVSLSSAQVSLASLSPCMCSSAWTLSSLLVTREASAHFLGSGFMAASSKTPSLAPVQSR